MEWIDEHDVLMLREMLASGVFIFKKESVSSGEAWDCLVETLNGIESPQFQIKDKRSERPMAIAWAKMEDQNQK